MKVVSAALWLLHAVAAGVSMGWARLRPGWASLSGRAFFLLVRVSHVLTVRLPFNLFNLIACTLSPVWVMYASTGG